MPNFDVLSPAELAQLSEAPVQIVALIGSADGAFDNEEQDWADRLVNVFTYAQPKLINDFYEPVSHGFVDKVKALLAALPGEAAAREAALEEKLQQVNALLAKLDPDLAAALYKSFRSLAQETAKASGGFLRIGAIGSAESRWVELPMIIPVHPPAH